MAEKYIINMPLKTTPDDTDLMIIEDAQDTKRMTWANVVKPIKDTVAAHEAENSTELIILNRDLSLVGVQTVSLVTQKKPKSFMIVGSVGGTKKISIGQASRDNGQCIYSQPSTGNYGATYPVSIAFADDATTNRSFGTIQNIQAGKFDINWTRTGTGATGTAQLSFLISYHGED